MCFSAQASIGAGIVLVSMGIVALWHMKDRRYVYLNLTPIFFGIQQFLEALVWTMGSSPDSQLVSFGKYGILFFAFIVWPLWAPWAVLQIEQGLYRKRMLYSNLFVGALISVFFAWNFFVPAVSCNDADFIIRVVLDVLSPLFLLGYFIVTVVPFFISQREIPNLFRFVPIFISGYFFSNFLFPFNAFMYYLACSSGPRLMTFYLIPYIILMVFFLYVVWRLSRAFNKDFKKK